MLEKKIIYHIAMVIEYLRYPKQAFGEFVRSYRMFMWVVKNWRLYYNTIQSLYNEWFDIDIQFPPGYMCNPNYWYCKYCGCKYVSHPMSTVHSVLDAWSNGHFDFSNEESRQKHAENCVHFSIQKLRNGGW